MSSLVGPEGVSAGQTGARGYFGSRIQGAIRLYRL